MEPGTYNINTLVSNDTFEAINVRLTDNATPTPNPIDITSAVIKWTVKASVSSPIAIQRTTANGGITITNAANGEFRINKINNFSVAAGNYIHEVEVTFTTGVRKTYLRGDFNVLFELA